MTPCSNAWFFRFLWFFKYERGTGEGGFSGGELARMGENGYICGDVSTTIGGGDC